jgi:hypothetical protein
MKKRDYPGKNGTNGDPTLHQPALSHVFLASAMDAGEWSVSIPVRLFSGKNTQWIRSEVSPERFWTLWWGEKSLFPHGIEPRFSGRPASFIVTIFKELTPPLFTLRLILILKNQEMILQTAKSRNDVRAWENKTAPQFRHACGHVCQSWDTHTWHACLEPKY